jgi:CRP-like cAMP-binding protein
MLGSGSVLGKPRIGSIVALTSVSYERIGASQLVDLLQHTEVALSLWDACSREQARVDALTVMLARGYAEERLSAFLLGLNDRLERQNLASGGAFHLPLKQVEIGDHLGLTVVHVNRVLRRLREHGFVSLQRGNASIDIRRLRQLAEGFLPASYSHGRLATAGMTAEQGETRSSNGASR